MHGAAAISPWPGPPLEPLGLDQGWSHLAISTKSLHRQMRSEFHGQIAGQYDSGDLFAGLGRAGPPGPCWPTQPARTGPGPDQIYKTQIYSDPARPVLARNNSAFCVPTRYSLFLWTRTDAGDGVDPTYSSRL